MPRGGLVAAIGRAYRDPRAAMAAQLRAGPREAQALFHLLLACGLYLLASLPDAVRRAGALGVEDALAGAIAAHLFGYLFLLPLLLYGIAALVHLAARVCGGRGDFPATRAAVFWAALLGAPIAIGLSLAGAGTEMAGGGDLLPRLAVLGYAGMAFWFWLFGASLAEAERFGEGFGASLSVTAALGACFAGIALAVSRVAGGASVAG